MGEGRPRSSCGECGEPLPLLRPSCANCDASIEWDVHTPCETCGRDVDATASQCPDCGSDHSVWRTIERDIAAAGSPATVWKDAVPRPSRAGYRRHLGSLKGQWADYRRVLDDSTEFHVLEFADHYEIHRDEVSALDDPAMHLVRYTPRIMVATAGGMTLGFLDTMIHSSRLLTNAIQVSASILPGDEP